MQDRIYPNHQSMGDLMLLLQIFFEKEQAKQVVSSNQEQDSF